MIKIIQQVLVNDIYTLNLQDNYVDVYYSWKLTLLEAYFYLGFK